MMFGGVVYEISVTRSPVDKKFLLPSAIFDPVEVHVHSFVRLILIVEFAKTTAVELLVCIRVGDCRYSSSCNVIRSGIEV